MKYINEEQTECSDDALDGPLVCVKFTASSYEQPHDVHGAFEDAIQRNTCVVGILVDTDLDYYIAERYNVADIPTYILMTHGVEIQRLYAPSQKQIEYMIATATTSTDTPRYIV